MEMMVKMGEYTYKKVKPMIKIKKGEREYIEVINGIIKTGDNRYKKIWNT